MRRTLYILIFIVFYTVSAFAQQKVIITLDNGETIEKEVWEVKSITFSEHKTSAASVPPKEDAVDLGLSVLWSPYNLEVNVGNTKESLFGWGDPYGTIKSTDLKFYPSLSPSNSIVATEYDIARALWKDKWRLPTSDEMKELIEKCEWEAVFDESNTLEGFKIIGNEGRYIILPVTGKRLGSNVNDKTDLGSYWTGNLVNNDNSKASCLTIKYGNETIGKEFTSELRCIGLAIRPVYGEYHYGISIVANATSITGTSASINAQYTGDIDQITEFGLYYAESEQMLEQNPQFITKTATELPSSNTFPFAVKNLSYNTKYYYIAYAKTQEKEIRSNVQSFMTASKYHAEAVDLGLPSGLLWTSCNLGAENENESGKLFAWADPSEKSYNQSTYTNAVEASIDDISSTKYDIATMTLGNEWHMPNELDFEELRKECEWTYITTPFVGWKVTGPNNNSILLPMCGNRQGDGTIVKDGTAAFYWTSINYSGLEAVYYTFSTSAKIAGKTAHSNKYIGMNVRPVKGNSNVPKSDEDDKNPSPYDNAAVDLGLSVDWASYNIGATKATEAGNKYAWGETEIKDSYTPNNYKHYVAGAYLSLGLDDISGSEYDPVHLLWGGDWQMPTNLQMMELFSECDWSWGKINGVDGFTITSKLNGNSIFLPVTEGNEGSYWSSTLYTLSGPFYNNSAYYLDFSENYTPTGCQYYYRYIGKCIRPVKIKR